MYRRYVALLLGYTEDDAKSQVSEAVKLQWQRSVKSFTNTCGPQGKKTCLLVFVNNKGADQHVHQCDLISTFWKVSYLNLLQAKF